MLQVSDCRPAPQGDPLTECTPQRLLPGEGAVDFAELFGVLDEIGAEPLVAPEVFNAELLALGPAEMARRIATRTRAVWG